MYQYLLDTYQYKIESNFLTFSLIKPWRSAKKKSILQRVELEALQMVHITPTNPDAQPHGHLSVVGNELAEEGLLEASFS